MSSRPKFRLSVLGLRAAPHCGPQTLTSVAEFGALRAMERVEISESELGDISGRIRQLQGFIEAGYPPEYDDAALRALGTHLFDMIIVQSVRRLFDRASGRRSGLLPLEIVCEDDGACGWPWEYLYDPSARMYIGQEFHPIYRSIFTQNPGVLPSGSAERVRILLIVGVPPYDPKTTPEEELKWIREVFEAQLAADVVEIKVMEAAAPADVDRLIQANKYDILHFYGHAGLDSQRREAYLKLERPPASPARLYANDFAQLVTERGIQLVFLNACETGKAYAGQDIARSSLAAALLDRGIPAIIANQFSMPDTSAHFFSSVVYNGLAAGKLLVDAVRDGRRAMGYAESAKFFDWGIPVVFLLDPDLLIFRRAKGRPKPHWSKRLDKTLAVGGSVVRDLAGTRTPGDPSITVERTRRRVSEKRPVTSVALADIDSKVGFLPDIAKAANAAQDYYHFKVAFPPIPSGAVRLDFEGGGAPPQMFLPRLESHLSTAPQDLSVHSVCCLTRHLLAGEEEGELYWDHFGATLRSNEHVLVISTFGLRDYSDQASVSFAKATLSLCLSMLLLADTRWDLETHEETAGCLLDYCANRKDLIVGLRHMRFDHAPCRTKIRDRRQLAAIDALLALEVTGRFGEGVVEGEQSGEQSEERGFYEEKRSVYEARTEEERARVEAANMEAAKTAAESRIAEEEARTREQEALIEAAMWRIAEEKKRFEGEE